MQMEELSAAWSVGWLLWQPCAVTDGGTAPLRIAAAESLRLEIVTEPLEQQLFATNRFPFLLLVFVNQCRGLERTQVKGEKSTARLPRSLISLVSLKQ